MENNRIYRIVREANHAKPWHVEVKTEAGFWQQVSPEYCYCNSATRYCLKNGIKITTLITIKAR